MEADSAEDLDTSVKGKQGELIVMGELLQRGYKVYTRFSSEKYEEARSEPSART